MGHRITQRIIECSLCEKIPEDGEYLWDMSGDGYICEECIDKDLDDDGQTETNQ